MMLGLGILLLLVPGLSRPGLALAVPALAIALTWLAARRLRA